MLHPLGSALGTQSSGTCQSRHAGQPASQSGAGLFQLLEAGLAFVVEKAPVFLFAVV